MRCHWLSVLTALAVRPLGCLATPLGLPLDNMLVKHTWDATPENWESLGYPPAGTTIDLRISLKPHHENALIDALYEVSSPNHPRHVVSPSLLCAPIYSREPLLWCRYGAHLSREQVAKLVAPHPDTLELVRSWLKHYGVPSSSFSMTHGGNWLKVTCVPVSQANELLGASYQLYQHVATNETILRTIGYALPAALQAHVQTVAPTTYFGSPRMLRKTPRMRHRGEAPAAGELRGVTSRNDDDDDYVTPSYLRRLYNSVSYVPSATDRNKLGIAGYLEEYPSPADLRLFMEKYRTDGLDATYTIVPINDEGYDPSNPNKEGDLAIQIAQGMAYPTPHTFYSTGGLPPFIPDSNTPMNTNEPYLDWLEYILDLQNIPQTISTSYGENEQTVPLDYATSVCDLFAKLGLRGVSVLFASGDDGVGTGDCMVNDGSGKVQFLPTFPASCMFDVLYTDAGTSRLSSSRRHTFVGPWVTSVGGTMDDPEVAADLSGGGFSNYFKLPSYQSEAVPSFLQNLGDQYDGLYKCVYCLDLIGPILTCDLGSASSRGFPDIAAQSLAFATFVNGNFEPLEGTSCSTPVCLSLLPLSSRDCPSLSTKLTTNVQVVAGIISLLNDFQLSQGRDPLGFLNPWLYGVGQEGLNDITSGSNPGCGTVGFSATVGWDPVRPARLLSLHF